ITFCYLDNHQLDVAYCPRFLTPTCCDNRYSEGCIWRMTSTITRWAPAGRRCTPVSRRASPAIPAGAAKSSCPHSWPMRRQILAEMAEKNGETAGSIGERRDDA